MVRTTSAASLASAEITAAQSAHPPGLGVSKDSRLPTHFVQQDLLAFL